MLHSEVTERVWCWNPWFIVSQMELWTWPGSVGFMGYSITLLPLPLCCGQLYPLPCQGRPQSSGQVKSRPLKPDISRCSHWGRFLLSVPQLSLVVVTQLLLFRDLNSLLQHLPAELHRFVFCCSLGWWHACPLLPCMHGQKTSFQGYENCLEQLS